MAKPPPTPKPATPKRRDDDPSEAFSLAFANGEPFRGPIPKLKKKPPQPPTTKPKG